MADGAVTGDFAALAEVIRRMNTAKYTVATMRQPAADAALAQIRASFAAGTSPDGAAWKPLRPPRAGTPLQGFDRHVATRVTPGGFVVGADHPGARAHQFGAVITPVSARMLRFVVAGRVVFAHRVTIPARPYLPAAELPASWAEAFEAVADAVLARHFGAD